MSFPILPKIKGTTIKKEKRAAFVLSIPNKTEVEMVAPDLEIPGKIAIACETARLASSPFLPPCDWALASASDKE